MTEIFGKDIYNISAHAFISEEEALKQAMQHIDPFVEKSDRIAKKAKKYIKKYRQNYDKYSGGIESFFSQYGLDSPEGKAIVTLAECLPRIPDSKTANDLIHDRFKHTDFAKHQGKSSSLFVNASSLGLGLAGKIFEIGSIVSKISDPVIRESIKNAISSIGKHFVMGQSIKEALKRAQQYEKKQYLLSYDILGEAARTAHIAEKYYQNYLQCIKYLTEHSTNDSSDNIYEKPSVSVKLSALYPRFELSKREKALKFLYPKIKDIAKTAKKAGIMLTIDAEEAMRLDLTLEIFKKLVEDEVLDGYNGLGLAVQSYSKRALAIVEWLAELAEKNNKIIPVRLVKGAYWDYEIKYAQMQGIEDFSVFTEKSYTDVNYLACAKLLLDNNKYLYPQFATHNAITIAAIEEITNRKHKYEFQRLHGMADELYLAVMKITARKCRIYAPVGIEKELLPYLIRRLLENGANSSFVKNLSDKTIDIKNLVIDPIKQATTIKEQKNSDTNTNKKNECKNKIILPDDVYLPIRKNSRGYDFGNERHLGKIMSSLQNFAHSTWQAAPIIDGKDRKTSNKVTETRRPYGNFEKTGQMIKATKDDIQDALVTTAHGFVRWNNEKVETRAQIIENFANLLEEHKFELMALCIRESGKNIIDALNEVREAIDFCRYYSTQARKIFAAPQNLAATSGEKNILEYCGKGVFVCISPWNFPLAIFVGQITAALLAGNTVIAKPAEQTSLVAHRAIKLLLRAGLPKDALALLTGSGAEIGKLLFTDERIKGIAFTGSCATANLINRTIATRKDIIKFIAETGGQNAMIIDSTALLEQAVDDVVKSAFYSAGQRCSALRVLYIQEDIKEAFYELLEGAMQELEIGNPEHLSTDIGPVIDLNAKHKLEAHINKMHDEGTLIATVLKEEGLEDQGYFVMPHAFEIASIDILEEEIFGPILHVIRYASDEIEDIIEQINSTGYGLTFGVQSRIEEKCCYLKNKIRAGNIYINRHMTGSIVGSQPFGGRGFSGTGPKAGGPSYLPSFADEKACSINTAAIGGDVELLTE